MAQNIIDSLSEDFLHCSICTERYIEPKMLPCLHSFCLRCLEQCVNNQHNDQTFPCPNCRYTVDLPSSGVSGFPNNFFLVGLIERFNEARNISIQNHDFNCNICGHAVGASFCLECKIHSCHECKGIHNRLAGTTDHPFISSERLSDENYVQRMISTRSLRCHTHKDEKLRYYCTQCNLLACQVCTVVGHQGHQSLQEIESKVNSVKEEWEVLLANSEIEASQLREKSSKTKSNAESIKQQTSSLIKKVDDRYNEILEKLQSDREKLKQELQGVEEEMCARLENVNDRISNLLRPLGNTQDMTRRILEQNNPREILEMENNIAESFRRLRGDTHRVDELSLPQNIGLEFSASKLIVVDREQEQILRNEEFQRRKSSSTKKTGAKREDGPFQYERDQNWLGNFERRRRGFFGMFRSLFLH